MTTGVPQNSSERGSDRRRSRRSRSFSRLKIRRGSGSIEADEADESSSEEEESGRISLVDKVKKLS